MLSSNSFGSLARSVVKLKKRSFSWKINLEQSSALLVNCLHLIYGLRTLERGLHFLQDRAPSLPFFLLFLFSFSGQPGQLFSFLLFHLFLLSSVWSGRLWGAGGGSRGSLTQRLCAAPSRSLASDNWAVSCPEDATLLPCLCLQLCLLSVVSWLVISVMSPCELDGIWPLCARQACCAWGNVQLGPKWPRECQTQPLERATRRDRAFFRCGWSELRRGFQQCDKWGEAGQGGQQPTMWGGQPAIYIWSGE